MKKILLLAVALLGASANNYAQTVLFEDSFETYTDFAITGIGDWLTIDIDGSTTYAGGLPVGVDPWTNSFLPQAYIVFNPAAAGATNATSGTELRNFDARPGGQKYMGSWAAVMPGDGAGGAGPNNDWLVSPVVALGTSQNEVKFWVKSLSSSYGLETYKVGIYVGTGAPTGASDFVIISGASNLVAPYNTWTEKTFNLDAYANQSVRVGILCNSADHYMFMVDDFKVTTAEVASADSFFANNFSMYPNPVANELNIVAKNNNVITGISIVDVNGRTVKNTNDAGLNNTSVNVSDLNSGVYFVTIETNEGTGTSKFIKN